MPKSICFICGGLAGGGQERALTNLTNEFAEKGNDITIICLFKTEVFFEIHPSIIIIWPTLDREKSNKFIYALKLIPYIRKNIIKINPDTIVSFGDWFNAYSILATRFLNKKVFITNRMGPNLYLGRFLEFFNKLTYKKATAMIVQTNTAKGIIQKKYGLKDIRVIPNAVRPVDLKSRLRENVIVTVGRLSKEKGHSVLLEAFSRLKDNSWRLEIIGDGPEMNNLQKMVSAFGLNGKVTFHGHKKEFKDILSKASLFVLPSFYEGFPNALVEAMSVPITSISSDCIAGPSEIIEHGKNGFLFETGNVDSLTKILNDLTNNISAIKEIEIESFKIRDKYNFKQISNIFLKNISN
jgi:glycosyltransferase involved in cell wall biosynthesis